MFLFVTISICTIITTCLIQMYTKCTPSRYVIRTLVLGKKMVKKKLVYSKTTFLQPSPWSCMFTISYLFHLKTLPLVSFAKVKQYTWSNMRCTCLSKFCILNVLWNVYARIFIFLWETNDLAFRLQNNSIKEANLWQDLF